MSSPRSVAVLLLAALPGFACEGEACRAKLQGIVISSSKPGCELVTSAPGDAGLGGVSIAIESNETMSVESAPDGHFGPSESVGACTVPGDCFCPDHVTLRISHPGHDDLTCALPFEAFEAPQHPNGGTIVVRLRPKA